jgi:hypothetical protein
VLAEQGNRVRAAGCPPGGRVPPPAGPPGRRRDTSFRCRSQYTALRFTETLQLAGLQPSTGTVGDACDNALAETTTGLYKTECTRDGSPFRTGPVATLGDLEDITSAWVHWYNTSRLMHRLGRRPPPKPKRSITLAITTATRLPYSHNEVRTKLGTLQM